LVSWICVCFYICISVFFHSFFDFLPKEVFRPLFFPLATFFVFFPGFSPHIWEVSKPPHFSFGYSLSNNRLLFFFPPCPIFFFPPLLSGRFFSTDFLNDPLFACFVSPLGNSPAPWCLEFELTTFLFCYSFFLKFFFSASRFWLPPFGLTYLTRIPAFFFFPTDFEDLSTTFSKPTPLSQDSFNDLDSFFFRRRRHPDFISLLPSWKLIPVFLYRPPFLFIWGWTSFYSSLFLVC